MVGQRRYNLIFGAVSYGFLTPVMIITFIESYHWLGRLFSGMLLFAAIPILIWAYFEDKNNYIQFQDDGIVVANKGALSRIPWASVSHVLVYKTGPYKFISIVYYADIEKMNVRFMRIHYTNKKLSYLRSKKLEIRSMNNQV